MACDILVDVQLNIALIVGPTPHSVGTHYSSSLSAFCVWRLYFRKLLFLCHIITAYGSTVVGKACVTSLSTMQLHHCKIFMMLTGIMKNSKNAQFSPKKWFYLNPQPHMGLTKHGWGRKNQMYAAHGAYGRVYPYCHTQSVATHETNKNCANMWESLSEQERIISCVW